MSGQIQRLNVAPTTTMMGVIKTRLRSATKGHQLLKRRSNALTLQFHQILKQIVETKESMGNLMKDSQFSLTEAKYIVGENIKHVVLENVDKATYKVQTKQENIAGVQLSIFEPFLETIELKHDLTGLAQGGLQIQLCKSSFVKVVKVLVELATLQTSFLTLNQAIKTTNRRVNALENIVNPKLENTISYIKTELDELEREEFFRLKKVQKYKKKLIEKVLEDKKKLLEANMIVSGNLVSQIQTADHLHVSTPTSNYPNLNPRSSMQSPRVSIAPNSHRHVLSTPSSPSSATTPNFAPSIPTPTSRHDIAYHKYIVSNPSLASNETLPIAPAPIVPLPTFVQSKIHDTTMPTNLPPMLASSLAKPTFVPIVSPPTFTHQDDPCISKQTNSLEASTPSIAPLPCLLSIPPPTSTPCALSSPPPPCPPSIPLPSSKQTNSSPKFVPSIPPPTPKDSIPLPKCASTLLPSTFAPLCLPPMIAHSFLPPTYTSSMPPCTPTQSKPPTTTPSVPSKSVDRDPQVNISLEFPPTYVLTNPLSTFASKKNPQLSASENVLFTSSSKNLDITSATPCHLHTSVSVSPPCTSSTFINPSISTLPIPLSTIASEATCFSATSSTIPCLINLSTTTPAMPLSTIASEATCFSTTSSTIPSISTSSSLINPSTSVPAMPLSTLASEATCFSYTFSIIPTAPTSSLLPDSAPIFLPPMSAPSFTSTTSVPSILTSTSTFPILPPTHVPSVSPSKSAPINSTNTSSSKILPSTSVPLIPPSTIIPLIPFPKYTPTSPSKILPPASKSKPISPTPTPPKRLVSSIPTNLLTSVHASPISTSAPTRSLPIAASKITPLTAAETKSLSTPTSQTELLTFVSTRPPITSHSSPLLTSTPSIPPPTTSPIIPPPTIRPKIISPSSETINPNSTSAPSTPHGTRTRTPTSAQTIPPASTHTIPPPSLMHASLLLTSAPPIPIATFASSTLSTSTLEIPPPTSKQTRTSPTVIPTNYSPKLRLTSPPSTSVPPNPDQTTPIASPTSVLPNPIKTSPISSPPTSASPNPNKTSPISSPPRPISPNPARASPLSSPPTSTTLNPTKPTPVSSSPSSRQTNPPPPSPSPNPNPTTASSLSNPSRRASEPAASPRPSSLPNPNRRASEPPPRVRGSILESFSSFTMSAFPILPLLGVHSSPPVTPDPLEPDLEEEEEESASSPHDSSFQALPNPVTSTAASRPSSPHSLTYSSPRANRTGAPHVADEDWDPDHDILF